MTTTLAIERFTKTQFESKRDWADHPLSLYTCPSCGAPTGLGRGELDSSLDRQSEPDRQELLHELREWCGWVWSDDCHAIHPFRCSGCNRLVLLGFGVSENRIRGRMYALVLVGETDDPSPTSATRATGSR